MGGWVRTHLLDVCDVHQLDHLVSLGGPRLGALEAQITSQGRNEEAQDSSQSGGAPAMEGPPRLPPQPHGMVSDPPHLAPGRNCTACSALYLGLSLPENSSRSYREVS